VGKRSVAEHAASTCQTASAREASLLPYGPTSSLLRAGDGAAACAVTCFTADSRQVPRGAFPDGTVCQLDSGTSRCAEHANAHNPAQEVLLRGGGVPSVFLRGRLPPPAARGAVPRRPQPRLARAGGGGPAGRRLDQVAARDQVQLLLPGAGPGAADGDPALPGRPVPGARIHPAGLRGLQRQVSCSRMQMVLSPNTATRRCRQLMTPFQYASQTCDNFQVLPSDTPPSLLLPQIAKLSGIGMQLTSTTGDPDRACRVACQDSSISYRWPLIAAVHWRRPTSYTTDWRLFWAGSKIGRVAAPFIDGATGRRCPQPGNVWQKWCLCFRDML
jgi:hypothetical protein